MRTFTLSATLVFAVAAPAAAQFNPPSQFHATMSSVAWEKAVSNPFTIASKTITLQLPAPSQITSDIALMYKATFNTSKGTYHPMIPVQTSNPNVLWCWEIPKGNVSASNKKEDGTCRIKSGDAKTITSDKTYTVTVGGNAGNKTLTVKVKPYVGSNYVAAPLQVVTNGVKPNDLITFRVKLMSPAAGQQQIAWGVTPRECFAQVQPGDSYNAMWTLSAPNVVVFGSGEQQRDITVRVANTNKCVGANRKFETWHPTTTSVLTAPTYHYVYFTIAMPTF